MNIQRRSTTFALDTITAFSDDELYQNYQKLKEKHETQRLSPNAARKLQVEICYLHREILIREARKNKHHMHMKVRMRN